MGCSASRRSLEDEPPPRDAQSPPASWCYLDDSLRATSPWKPFLPHQAAKLEAAWAASSTDSEASSPSAVIVDVDSDHSVDISRMKLLDQQRNAERAVRRLMPNDRSQSPYGASSGAPVATLGSGSPLSRAFDGGEAHPGGDEYGDLPDSPIPSYRSASASSDDTERPKQGSLATGEPGSAGPALILTANEPAPPPPEEGGSLFWHYLNRSPPKGGPIDPDTVQRWGEIAPAQPTVGFLGAAASASVGAAEVEYFASAELNFRLALWQGDITRLKVDALVSCSNEALSKREGAAGDIFGAAGPQLAEACARLGGCKPGEARVTRGFELPAKHVIHTVPPEGFAGGSASSSGAFSSSRGAASTRTSARRSVSAAAAIAAADDPDATQLERCYTSSLAAARLLRCRTVAFTWHHRGLTDDAKRRRAAHVALRMVRQLLEQPASRGKPELLILAFRPEDVDPTDSLVYRLYRDELLPAYFPRSAAEERSSALHTKVLPKVPDARLLPLSGREISPSSKSLRSIKEDSSSAAAYNRERLPPNEGFSSDDDDDDSVGAVAGEYVLECPSDDEPPEAPDARYRPLDA